MIAASGALAQLEEEAAGEVGGQGFSPGGLDGELHGGEGLAGNALGLEVLGGLRGQRLDLGREAEGLGPRKCRRARRPAPG